MALRVAFFGTPAFAVPTLDQLLRSSHLVVGVITQPDRPRGRGQHVTAGPVKAVALAAGLPVLQPERLSRDWFEAPFLNLGADIGVVAAYGRILPDWLLAAPRLGLINVHASLLPRFRGASPIHRAVMAGDAETGVTIMRVVKALDAGAMLAAAHVPIGADDTAEDVERVLAVQGAALLVDTLDRIERGPVPETPQDEAFVTYAPKLTKAEGAVDWSRPAQEVHNKIRGLSPRPRSYAFLDGTRFIVHRSRVADRPAGGTAPGTVMAASAADGLVVACGDGRAIEITELQLEGRRAMPARELLASRHVEPGARFTTT